MKLGMKDGGPKKPASSNKKVANGLVAMSCGAVLAVYSAGYARTRSAAASFDVQSEERRAAAPGATLPIASENARPQRELAAEEAGLVAPAPSAVSEPSHPLAREVATSAAPVSTRAEVQNSAPAPIPAPQETSVAPAPVATPAPSIPAPAPVTASVQPVAAPVVASPVLAPPPVPQPKAEIAAAVAPAAPAPKWKDGTYYGWGTSRHGNIQAEVIISGGRIASATISDCRTRYPCSVIEQLPPEVAQRQSPEVDYVSRATQSTNAFYFAVVEALGKAKI
jgi:uncharacterized protein with FMN-binding domain